MFARVYWIVTQVVDIMNTWILNDFFEGNGTRLILGMIHYSQGFLTGRSVLFIYVLFNSFTLGPVSP